MPRITPVRGKLVIVERNITKEFMFNPAEITDTKGTNYGEGEVAGASHPVVQFGSGKVRKITFELYLDGDRGQIGRGKETLDITDEVNFYRSLEYPTKYGGGVTSVAPYVVLFSLGKLYQNLPVVVESTTPVRYTYFTPDMTPVRATLSMTLREYVTRSQTAHDVFPDVDGDVTGGEGVLV